VEKGSDRTLEVESDYSDEKKTPEKKAPEKKTP
jgi:hypothetical protein